MNKEELIGKLQMVYVGDKNALNELNCYYDELKQCIEQLRHKIEFLTKRDNKLQQIEQMFKNGQVDLSELSKLVKDK